MKDILLYNFNKDGIKVIYNKDDLNFEFKLPDHLLFASVGENTKELLALSGTSTNDRIIMSLLDGVKVQDDLKKFMNMGFTVHSVDYLTSPNLEKRLLKTVMSRGSLRLNVYYIYIANHLIRYDSKEIELSRDLDIILSIKVL